ncbi:non-ribosomal peptide synthetase, partial [Nocardia miyunensis]|uniref:non-ribosomal peptide synthetase n=1 Tax=Nocardia miyunensis TaxID=282684 RepID=UPI0012F4F160
MRTNTGRQQSRGSRRRGSVLFPSLLTAAVEYAADTVAIRFSASGDPADVRQLTYRELDESSSRLARELIARGIGADDAVAVGIARSIESVLAVWAIAKTGAAFVPVDPAYPAERIEHILSDSGAVLGLTTTAHRAAFTDGGPDWLELDDPAQAERIAAHPAHPVSYADRVRTVTELHPAYYIYTSGSTGRPKGVVVGHGGLGSLVTAMRESFGVDRESRVAHVCSPNFDVSVLELMLAFSSGATLVVSPPQVFGGHELAELLRRERVTHMLITPGALESVDSTGLDDLRTVMVAGDRFGPELVGRWARDGRSFLNGYGPTEATILATATGAMNPDELVTIGTAVPGMGAFVLDARLRPVPAGTTGELYLSGPALARGYLGRPGLTSERFVASPFAETGKSAARLYRTGDLVRRTESGTIEYLGRTDFQVKIRGVRIELGEIDNALTAHPDIDYAATLDRTLPSGSKALVSYVLPRAGTAVDTDRLAEFLAESLPAYMIPALIMVLDAIPLTSVGKLDRAALPEPVFEAAEFRAPVTENEILIAELFAGLLGVERVGLDDSFFGLGGDSILSIQLVSRAKARGLAFTAQDVFNHRTVAGLAEIASAVGESAREQLAELPGGGVGEMPLTPLMAATLAKGPAFQRYSQSMTLRLPDGLDDETLLGTLSAVLDHHDVLRSRLRGNAEQGWTFEALAQGAVDVAALVRRVDLPADIDEAELTRRASAEFDAALGRLDPAGGAMVQFVRFAFAGDQDAQAPGRSDILLVVAHHFAIDGVSWRIIIPDLMVAWLQIAAGQPVALPAVGTSMRRWAHALAEAARRPEVVAELPLWQEISRTSDPQLGERPFDPAIDTLATVERVRVTVPPEVTEAALTTIPTKFRGGANDALLSALALAVSRWRGDDAGGAVLVRLEGHGREEDFVPGADLSHTVGWFTSAYPVRIGLVDADFDAVFDSGPVAGEVLKAVKEQLLAVPGRGLGFGLLSYFNAETADQLSDLGQITFNYLGRIAAGGAAAELAESGWAPTGDLGDFDADLDRDMPANGAIDINAIVTDGPDGPQLGASFAFPAGLLSRQRVQRLADLWVTALTALARHAQRPDAGGLTPSDLPLVRAAQSDITVWERNYPALSEIWPLSPLQSGLLFHTMLTQSTVDVYTIQARVDLGGTVDTGRLRMAAQAIVDRYPSLRVAFATGADGQSVQVVLDRVTVPWREEDLTALPEPEREPELVRRISADRAMHFDPATPPLLRFTVYRTASDRWHLAITTHHILLDGWSMPVLLRDLLLLYATRGDASALPRPESYRNFLTWLSHRDRDESLRLWGEALAGVDEPTVLARQPKTAENYEIGKVVTGFDAEATRRITEYAAELGVTLNTVVQAAWGILLGRLIGRDDVVFGAAVSGRPADLPGVESMVGLFVNTVPVRVRVEGGVSVAELLRELQRAQVALFEHHHVGLTDIQRIAGDATQFDSLLVFESYPLNEEAIAAASSIDGMSVTGVGMLDDSHYPLTLVVLAESTLEVTWKYLRSRFTDDEVETLAARMIRVLDALVANPQAPVEAIDVLDPAERDQIVRGWNDTAHPIEHELLQSGFRRAMEEHPDRTALVYEGAELTYREFGERVNRLARLLISRGVGADSVVGVAIRRSPELLIAIYAIRTAGGAYAPVDPDHPAERIEYVFHTARPVCVLTTTADLVSVPDGIEVLRIDAVDTGDLDGSPLAAAELLRPVRPENLAYVMFTSGSTGRPKGVAVSQGALVNHMAWMQGEYPLNAEDVYLLKAAVTFDSIWGYYLPLRVGATLVIATHDGHRDAQYIAETIAAQRVTVTDFVPSMLSVFVSHAAAGSLPTLRLVISGGELLPSETVAGLRALGAVDALNVYGPTETTIAVTTLLATGTEQGGLPIGSPGWNNRVYVLDSRLRPVPAGVAGELYIAGDQLARGYIGREELTAERFVADPFGSGARMYRTGDLAAWSSPGVLKYLGRTDFQVKLRGQRIELGEIESALTAQPEVAQAAVAVIGSDIGDQLVGYAVAASGARIEPEQLRAALGRILPPYMVPVTVMELDALPLNASGKLDRKALPRPTFAAREFRAPSTPIEEIVARVFAEVLGVDRVGADDDFFTLGGNSLVATQVVARLGAALNARVPVRALFDTPTVAALAAGIVPGA